MTAPKPVEAVARDAESIGYVRGLSKAADWTRAFDQDLPGFDRPTCVNLANGLGEMARHAGERLGVAVDFNKPPAPMFHDCCIHDGHGGRASAAADAACIDPDPIRPTDDTVSLEDDVNDDEPVWNPDTVTWSDEDGGM